MTKLSYIQKRIRACDRILRKEYWKLKYAIKYHLRDSQAQDAIQERINYFEEEKDRIEISL